MRKEIVWVVTISIVLGLIVAFGFYRINYSVTKNVGTPQPSSSPKSGNPELRSLTAILGAAGLRLSVKPIERRLRKAA